MKSHLLSLVFCASCLGAAVAGPPDGATVGESGPVPVSGHVLLKNGRVLSGDVVAEQGRYRLVLPHGEISLRGEDVAAVCRDLNEAYQHRLASGKPEDTNHRLKTALWCIDQGLFDQARGELAAVGQLSPNDRRVEYVERRLQLAQAPRAEFAAAAAIPAPPRGEVVSHQELDRLVRNLPKGTPETFTEVVQPLLVNRCGTSNCHGIASTHPLRLLRPPSNKSQAARITQRNLHAVLQYVDHQDPDSSQLLQAASEPHAGSAVPLLNEPQHAHLTQLAEWIAQVTERERLARQVNGPPATITLSRPTAWDETHLNQVQRAGNVRRGWQDSVQHAGFQQPMEPIDEAGPQMPSDYPQQRSVLPSAIRGARAAYDELDPAEFNRRYFGDARPYDE